jgi:hypothetical protein
MPAGWLLCGLAAAGDGRSGYRATAAACAGPAPLGGQGEWLIVAEEPGIGLGAGYATTAPHEPQAPPTAPPSAKIVVRGHPMPLWPVLDCPPDRSAYVGEAAGVWIWLICFPADAGYAVLEDLAVSDVRHRFVPLADSASLSRRLRPGQH